MIRDNVDHCGIVPMPRKPRLPEPLEIEGLSTGKPPVKPFKDDLSDEIIQPKPTLPSYLTTTLKSAQQVLNERKAVDRLRAEAFLERFMPKAKPVELIPKGMRKIGELNGKAVLIENKPWRRV